MKDLLDRIVGEAQTALGENLLAVVLYGSHARGEATAKSDVNLIMIIRDQSAEKLAPLAKLMPAWLKKRVAPPVILQQDQIGRSLDTFSLEFVEMAAARKVLFGDDPFVNFSPDWAAVRRDLEREARQKRIALTRRWLAAGGKDAILRALITDTVSGYFTLLRGTLMLKRKEILSLTNDAVLTELGGKSWFRQEVWARLRAVAMGKTKIGGAELQTLMNDYLQQAVALTRRLDELE
ncbi:nucleotidyltransferase domain-containing protein [bacterium]|nr:nucleotidyltransferase domain-containing protein [bacterium]MBU1985538.1 nucleotidyltransferase domain-containing protein [bacterium]